MKPDFSDTRPIHDKFAPYTPEVLDLLIHDTTFDTFASDAGIAGTALNAQSLTLFHMSPRYTSIDAHLKNAARVYTGEVFVPANLSVKEIAFPQ